MNEAPLGLLFGILAALILLSGFFSGSETGMMALNRYRLKHLKKQKHPGAVRADKLLRRPDRLIGIILLGNNLINNFATAIVTVIALRVAGDAGIAIGAVLLTIVILIFAEVSPKTIAALHPERIAFPASYVLLPLLKVFYPIVWLINAVANLLLRVLGVNPAASSEHKLSPEELRTIVGESGHMIPKRHQGMLLNILDLEQVTVDDIMIPRSEVVGIDLAQDDETILRQLRATEFTRIPVYKENIDNIHGLLHQRYVSRAIGNGGTLNRKALLRELDEAYFVPESTPLHTQLFNFQKLKTRMGLVVDEYGRIMGIVTLEDILEEIVGEFTSNLADETEEITPQEDGSYLIDGTAAIRDINKTLGWELSTDGPKTVNGLLLEHLESFPDGLVGLRVDNCLFEVLEIKGNKFQLVKAIPAVINEQ